MGRGFTDADLRQLQANLNKSAVTVPEPVKPKSDIDKLNKTERMYWEYLKRMDYAWIGVQNITLKLGFDCRFSCDFFVLTKDGRFEAHETKGNFFRDDAKVKLNVAARAFPFITFILVKRVNNEWVKKVVSQ